MNNDNNGLVFDDNQTNINITNDNTQINNNQEVNIDYNALYNINNTNIEQSKQNNNVDNQQPKQNNNSENQEEMITTPLENEKIENNNDNPLATKSNLIFIIILFIIIIITIIFVFPYIFKNNF